MARPVAPANVPRLPVGRSAATWLHWVRSQPNRQLQGAPPRPEDLLHRHRPGAHISGFAIVALISSGNPFAGVEPLRSPRLRTQRGAPASRAARSPTYETLNEGTAPECRGRSLSPSPTPVPPGSRRSPASTKNCSPTSSRTPDGDKLAEDLASAADGADMLWLIHQLDRLTAAADNQTLQVDNGADETPPVSARSRTPPSPRALPVRPRASGRESWSRSPWPGTRPARRTCSTSPGRGRWATTPAAASSPPSRRSPASGATRSSHRSRARPA
jgi:hypothetical protein